MKRCSPISQVTVLLCCLVVIISRVWNRPFMGAEVEGYSELVEHVS